MKAFVKEIAGKHRRQGSFEMQNCDKMMDQVVTWCISEFYAEP